MRQATTSRVQTLLAALAIMVMAASLMATVPTPTASAADLDTAAPSCQVSRNPAAYQPITIECVGPERGEEPETFRDFRFNVEIAAADAAWNVPGYFAADGNAANTSATSGNVWRAHFNPPAAGDFTYTVSMRQGSDVAVSLSNNVGAAVGPDGETGSFRAAAPQLSADGFNTRGKLEYAPVGYPQFANGDYFVKGGPGSPETFLGAGDDFDGTPSGSNQMDLDNFEDHLRDWSAGDPSWAGTKGRGIIGAVNYIESVGMNSMYMITMAEGGDGNNVFPWPGRVRDDINNLYTYDVSKLAQWAVVFAHMYDQGVHAHLLTTETETEQFFEHWELGVIGGDRFPDSRKVYYRELVARFGHLNVTWDIGEEFGGVNDAGGGYPAQQGQAGSNEQLGLYADYFQAIDPYETPVVVHTRNNELSAYINDAGLSTATSFDGLAIQARAGQGLGYLVVPAAVTAENGRRWLFSFDEQAPAQTANPCNRTPAQLYEARTGDLWATFMSGGWGVEWYGGYQTCGNDFNHRDFRDRDALYRQTGHAISLFEQFSPRLGATRVATIDGVSPTDGRALASPGDWYLAYFTQAAPAASVEVARGSYTRRWFNPRTGEFTNATAASGSEVIAGNPPSDPNLDWVLVIEAVDLEPERDVDDSGTVDNADVLYLLRAVVRGQTLPAGDQNGDGSTSLLDALLLAQFVQSGSG